MADSTGKVLITGAGGFVGTHLMEYAGMGSSVTGVYRAGSRVSPCEGVTADLAAPGWTHRLPGEVEVVVHLAQSRGYRDFPEAAADIFNVNVRAGYELLEWCRGTGVRRLVLASTGSVYRQKAGALQESDPCEPDSAYGASKLAMELWSRQYGTLFEVVVLRLFGIYGPGQQGMLIPGLIHRLQNGNEIRLAHGSGMRYTPLFIDDCVALIADLSQADLPSPVEVVNVAGAEVADLRDVVGQLSQRLGCDPCIRETDEEIAFQIADTTRLGSLLGGHDFVPLHEGIKRTVDAHAIDRSSS